MNTESAATYKTLAFVSLFKNVRQKTKKDGTPIFDPKGKPVTEAYWNATFKAGTVDASSRTIPAFDKSLFESTVSSDGKTRYLRSKTMLVVEYTALRAGKVAGKWFTNIVSLAQQPTMSVQSLDALLDGHPTNVTEPAPAEAAEADDDDGAEEVPEF